jgi:hypothetical protein
VFPRETGVVAREYDLLLEAPYRFASMKTLLVLIFVCLIGAFGVRAAEPAKELEREQQQVVALAKEVQAQQTTIADNQTKIDAKVVTIGEALRLAKIYASRAGR